MGLVNKALGNNKKAATLFDMAFGLVSGYQDETTLSRWIIMATPNNTAQISYELYQFEASQ